jgi:serine protease Do
MTWDMKTPWIPPEPDFPWPPERRRRSGGKGKVLCMAVIAAVIVTVAVVFTLPFLFGANPVDILSGKSSSETQETRTVKEVTLTSSQDTVVGVAEKMLPCVVYIEAEFRSFMRGGSSSAIGSGFIYSSDGYIVTNNHLVEGASAINVSLADGTTSQGRLIGNDRDKDLALVKIEARDLPVAGLGDSSSLVVGELVVAIGSPEGFEHSVTSGIVSALGRDIYIPPSGPDLRDLIQTDAAINPGNSGGPLCNGLGEVVGINTAIVSESGGYDGIGFAIPIDDAVPVIEKMVSAYGG